MDVLLTILAKASELKKGYCAVCACHERFALLNDHIQESIGQLKKAQELKKPELQKAVDELMPLATEAVQLMRRYADRSIFMDLFAAVLGDGAAEDVEDLLRQVTACRNRLSEALGIETYKEIQEVKDMLTEAKEKDAVQLDILRTLDEKLTKHMEKDSSDAQMVAFFQGVSSELPESCVSSTANFYSVLAVLESRLEKQDLSSLLYGTEKREFKDLKVLRQHALKVIASTQGVLKKLPTEVMQNDERAKVEEIERDLEGRRSRLRDLTMRVCFVGPTKSGKSTAINAILGEKIAPSDLDPMTVLPTVLRHSNDRKRPLLRLPSLENYRAAIRSLKNKHDQDPELAKAIQGDKENFTDGEKEVWLEVLEGKLHGGSFQEEEEYERLKDCSAVLRTINHLCRLCSRANKIRGYKDRGEMEVQSPITGLLQESNPWPCIETRMHLLCESGLDHEGSGIFEIMDTPGRDEMELIPEIRSIVKSAVEGATCCVCVCNATTKGNDAHNKIKQELALSCRFSPAVYILANKSDMLRDDKARASLKTSLAREFLGDAKRSNQVYPVSAKWELMYSIVRTLERNHSTQTLVAELRGLPDVDWETDNYTEMQLQLKEWAQEMYESGGTNWQDKMDDDWAIHDAGMKNLHKKSEFEPFQSHLMNEVAPNAGRQIIFTHTDKLFHQFTTFTNNLDFIIGKYGADAQVFDETNRRLREFRARVNGDLAASIQNMRDETLSKARNLIRESSKGLENDMKAHVSEEIDRIFNDADMASEGLLKSVTDADIEKFPYLESGWKGKAVWRFFDKSAAANFEGRQRGRAEAAATLVLTNLEATLQAKLQTEVQRLTEKADAKLQELQDEDDMAGLQLDLAAMELPKLKLNVEGTDTSKYDKAIYSEWYLLWIFPIRTKAGDVACIVHDSDNEADEALKQSLQNGCVEASSKALGTMESQVESYVHVLQGAFMAQLNAKVEAREHQMRVLEEYREKREKGDLMRRCFMARLELEGLRLDAKIARDLSRPGEKGTKFSYSKTIDLEDLAAAEAGTRAPREVASARRPRAKSPAVTESEGRAPKACVGCAVPGGVSRSNSMTSGGLLRKISRTLSGGLVS